MTVHNPYHPDGPRDDANLNSEITMIIKDDDGQFTQKSGGKSKTKTKRSRKNSDSYKTFL